jgi:hypothetical protein
MKRQLFIYKQDHLGDVVLKPYCFRWVLAYRLKEFYLWAFFKIAAPFVYLAKELGRCRQGEDVLHRWSEIMRFPFKPLKLERK